MVKSYGKNKLTIRLKLNKWINQFNISELIINIISKWEWPQKINWIIIRKRDWSQKINWIRRRCIFCNS